MRSEPYRPTGSSERAMSIAGISHAAFAATMIALGILGLPKGDFAPVLEIVPAAGFGAYLCALIFLGSGLGLLWERTARHAARALLAWFLLWMLFKKVPAALSAPTELGNWYGCAENSVMVAGTWVLYAWFAGDEEKRRFAFATGGKGLRIARVFYALALIFFGAGHFAYVNPTASLVPAWLPGHVFWAYFTAGTFIGAGIAVLIGLWARLAAALSVLQIGLFIPLVWLPLLSAGKMTVFQRGEFAVTCALAVAGWVVADSYRESVASRWQTLARPR